MSFQLLPLEIVLNIVSFLDGTSVLKLLKAHPELRASAVVIVLKNRFMRLFNDLRLKFFEIEGVAKRVLYKRPPAVENPETGVFYRRGVDRFPIKLIECRFRELCNLSQTLTLHIPHTYLAQWPFSFPVTLDSTTFIHVWEPPWTMNSHDCQKIQFSQAQDTIDLLSNAKLQTLGGSVMPLRPSLRCLTLDHAFHVENLDLSFVDTLIIGFSASTAGHRPTLKNIKTNNLTALIINFEGRVPQFENITFREHPDPDETNAEKPVMMLSNTAAANLCRPPAGSPIATAESTADCGLEEVVPFFDGLVLNGVPSDALQGCNLTKLRHLYCNFTLKEKCADELVSPLHMPNLNWVTIRVSAPGVTIPPIVVGELDLLQHPILAISILAHDVDVDKFIRESVFLPDEAYIYRSPHLEKEKPGSHPFHWTNSWDKILGHASSMAVVGFEMSCLQYGSPHQMLLRRNSSARMHLQPYIHNTKDKDTVVIRMPDWHTDPPRYLCLKLELFPILEEPRATTQRQGTLSLHCTHETWSKEFTDISVSPDFERYLCNGLEAELEPVRFLTRYSTKPTAKDLEEAYAEALQPKAAYSANITLGAVEHKRPKVYFDLEFENRDIAHQKWARCVYLDVKRAEVTERQPEVEDPVNNENFVVDGTLVFV